MPYLILPYLEDILATELFVCVAYLHFLFFFPDINECEAYSRVCGDYGSSECINNVGSYTCVCHNEEGSIEDQSYCFGEY